MLLTSCSEMWGRVELRQKDPDAKYIRDSIYVPYQSGEAWGIFSGDGKAFEGTVDLHGPDARVQDQILSWSGEASAIAPDEHYLYGGVLNPHFGHFLINSLSRLWPLGKPEFQSTKVLFHAAGTVDQWFNLAFVGEIFTALGLGLNNVCIFDRPTRVSRLVAPAPSVQEQAFVHTAYGDLCRFIGSRVLHGRPVRTGLPPAYISKTGLKAGVGHVLNEAPLEKGLADAGIEIVHPEVLPFHEQIALFVERPVILGTISSTFHISIFVPPRAKLLVLSTIPGPNSNFLLLDAVNQNAVEYVYAKGTEVVTLSNSTFITSYRLPEPDRLANELLARLGLPSSSTLDIHQCDGQQLPPSCVAIHETSAQVSENQEDGAMALYSLFLSNTGRPIHKSGHYFFAYERHFTRYVGGPVTFLEIGAGNGGSCQMWKRWLGPLARIVSIDINPVCKQFEDEQISIRIGDQSDPVFLQSLLDEFGTFDIVLDDGSHHMTHVNASFDFLYSRISANGVYMIEDMHTAYWTDYGGGTKAPASAVERFKDLIDLLNAEHVRDGTIKPAPFTRSTVAMTAYDSILVFERAPMINKHMRMIGDDKARLNY